MKEEFRTPFILVISSPSGGGKTTIVQRLLKEVPGIRRSVSYTTRKPRRGEEHSHDYVFVSESEFKEMIQKNEFLEWEENFGYYYGTSAEQVRECLSEKEDIILSIDVKGARSIKERIPESVSVFIMPPSIEELSERLRKRNTDHHEEMERRLKESHKEIAASNEYDYLIVNKDLDEAVQELKAIIEKERRNRKNNPKG